MPSAIKTLRHYVDCVMKHEEIAREHKIERNTSDDRDVDVWTEACAIAMKACGEVGDVTLPRVIRSLQIDGVDATDLQDHRISYICPAQMDDKLAKTSTYALATALYIHKQLARGGLERITVCMDVRAGRGWPNIHAMHLMPFMKQSTTLLLSLFPE